MIRLLLASLLLLVTTGASWAGPRPPSFTTDIAPLLREHCLRCHSGSRPRGDLDLTSAKGLLTGGVKGPALKPGRSADSLLLEMVRDGKMPPRKPLSRADVDKLHAWIDAGARWEGPDLQAVTRSDPGRAGSDWWSLQPLRPVAVPRLGNHTHTPIDAFLLAKLQQKGLSFSAEADRRTLIRRLHFDLLGLPPTPEVVSDFLADARPDAYERLVDRLLASPQYGERWARHWLDVARFAESHGYEMNTLRPTAWPYRDYVIRAFNSDLPYRQFVREQLAGDVLGRGDPLSSSATGFLVAGPHDMVGNATLEGKLQQRADDLADIVSTTATTFLGLTVGCARCHDHKFDPVSQTDFYALQAVFAGIEHAERSMEKTDDPERQGEAERLKHRLVELDRLIEASEPLAGMGRRQGVSPRTNLERFAPVKARFVRFTILATTDGSEPCLDELELYGPEEMGNLALADRGVKTSASSVYPNNAFHRLEHVNDGQHGNSRSWISAERGKGWVQLTLPRLVTIERIIWGRDRQERYRDRLARDYRIEVSQDGEHWKTVASSEDRLEPGKPAPASKEILQIREEQQRVRARLAALVSVAKIYAGTFRQPDVVHRLRRGDVLQKQEVVGPGAIAAVRPALSLVGSLTEPQRRLALADWLTEDGNPLSVRVLVNRLWHWHFGQGIVRTPSDFGYNGDRPSHPELLDFLAGEFVRQGGRVKPVQRMIVLSRAYRQASRQNASASAIDADNRLLWRFSPRRLEAEALRDTVLGVSGTLNGQMGGPGYHLWDYSGYVIVFKPKEKLGPPEFRRMIYQFKPRLQQDGTFGAFDCPDATGTMPRRNVSTTALQALNLLNDPFMLDQAERFAGRLRQEAGGEARTQVERAFDLAFARKPTPTEAHAALALVREHGLAQLCRALFNANEFVFVH